MAHALAGRGGDAGDVGHDRLGDLVLDEIGGGLLGATPDLPDQDDALGLIVGLKTLQAGNEIHAVDGITADTDTGTLAQADVGGLEDRLVGQGAGAGDDAHATRLVNAAGHDADLAGAGGDDAGAVGANQDAGAPRQGGLDLEHIEDRDAFGNADDDADARVRRLQDGVGGKGRRDIDHGGVGPGLAHGIVDRIKDGTVEVPGAALARGDAAHQLGAVGDGLFTVEGALLAGKALANDTGVLVNQYAHVSFPLSAGRRRRRRLYPRPRSGWRRW